MIKGKCSLQCVELLGERGKILELKRGNEYKRRIINFTDPAAGTKRGLYFIKILNDSSIEQVGLKLSFSRYCSGFTTEPLPFLNVNGGYLLSSTKVTRNNGEWKKCHESKCKKAQRWITQLQHPWKRAKNPYLLRELQWGLRHHLSQRGGLLVFLWRWHGARVAIQRKMEE